MTLPGDINNIELEGGPGNNFIQVDPSVTRDVTIYGGPGNNVLMAGSGDDTLIAGTGTAVLYGGTGDDTLYGGEDVTGVDDVTGEPTYAVPPTATDADEQSLTIAGATWASNVATITTSGPLPGGLLAGQNVTISGVTPAAYNGTFTIASVVSSDQFTYALTTNSGAVAALPTTNAADGNDTLIAGPGDDELIAGSGNDLLIGGSVAQLVNPVTAGTPGVAQLENGQYQLVDGAGRDILTGGAGNDVLIAGPGSPGAIMEAGTGNNTLDCAELRHRHHEWQRGREPVARWQSRKHRDEQLRAWG